MNEQFDVFVSYAHADAAWVKALAFELRRRHIKIFFDEWELAPGDRLAHRLEEGIRNSRNGIFVVSPASVSRPWAREEYESMLARAVAGRMRLVPVLLKDTEMPPFLANRVWVDFRTAEGASFDEKVQELIFALKGQDQPPGPPAFNRTPRDPGPTSTTQPLSIKLTWPAIDGDKKWDDPVVQEWLQAAKREPGGNPSTYRYEIRGIVTPPAPGAIVVIDILTNDWWPQQGGVAGSDGQWTGSVWLHDARPSMVLRIEVKLADGSVERKYELTW